MRVAFTVFLAFLLIACQTAPAATPMPSPTMQPSLTPLPAATATSESTSTAIPTPTISPAELKRRAGPICDNAFSALVETGPLTPPFAVLKKITYADAPSWELSNQLPHLGSFSAAEVHTVFCISETRAQTGIYTDGSTAYQLFWEVRVVSWPVGKVIGKQSFTGPPPSKTNVFSPGSAEGLFPYKDFAAWIFNQIDHPDFLYFNDAITSVAISPDGDIAAFGTAIANQIVDRDYQAKIFLFHPSDLQTDLGTSAFLNALPGHQGMVTSLVFSPDGKLLVSCGYDRLIKFWDMKTGGLLGQVRLMDTPNFLAFSQDGKKLAVASNLEVTFVNPLSIQIEQSIAVGSGGDLTFSPDGSLIYVSTPFRIAVIDSNAGATILEFPNRSVLLPTLTVAEDGSIIGVAYETPDTVDNFVLYPDGARVITSTLDQSVDPDSGVANVRLATWDARTGKYLSEIKFSADSVQALKLAPYGTLLGIATDNAVWVWDTSSWQIVKIFSGHVDLIEDLVFTPDGTKIISAGRDGTIRVWSLEK
jgi:WD40 repeat protein